MNWPVPAVPKRVSREQVLQRLRSYLSSKACAPQQRLEPERNLAARLGCSRDTVRAALAVLEREGVVWRHVGQGTFVGPRPGERPVDFGMLSEIASPLDVLDARLVLEPGIAAAAATAATSHDIALLRDLARQTTEARSWQAYEHADDALHKRVARATRNPLLVAALEMLSSVRGRARWQRHHDLAFRRAHKREYAAQQGRMHTAIIDALERRDPDLARRAMSEHLEAIRAIFGAAALPVR